MVKSRAFAALVAVVGVASLPGCGAFSCGCNSGSWRPGPYAGMKYDVCCETCGPNCGPSCHGAGGCGAGCTSCGSTVGCGSACGAGCCGTGGCRLCPLLNCLGCKGCGGLYWCEWYNDPPNCCEPCDCYGNYIGPGTPGYYQAPYLRGDDYQPTPLSDAAPAAASEAVDRELDQLAVDAE